MIFKGNQNFESFTLHRSITREKGIQQMNSKIDFTNLWSRYISWIHGPYINQIGKPSDQRMGTSQYSVSLTYNTHIVGKYNENNIIK